MFHSSTVRSKGYTAFTYEKLSEYDKEMQHTTYQPMVPGKRDIENNSHMKSSIHLLSLPQ